MQMVFVLHRKHTSPRPVTGIALRFYVDDVRTSQEAWTTTVRYGDSFTLLYVGDVRASQEAWTTTVRYGDSFTLLYVGDVCTSQETYVCRTCYEMALSFCVCTTLGLAFWTEMTSDDSSCIMSALVRWDHHHVKTVCANC
jgi:hypothetical protein